MRRSLDRCRVCDRLEDVHTAAELQDCARRAENDHGLTPRERRQQDDYDRARARGWED